MSDAPTGTELRELRNYRQGMAATAIRLAGATYIEVAEALGLGGPSEAREMIESTLAQQVTEQDRESLRREEGARLDRLQRSVWHKATDPEHPDQFIALNATLKIMESRRRLFGLDAPAEVTVYTPTQNELEQWVAEMSHAQVADFAALEATVVELPAAADDG